MHIGVKTLFVSICYIIDYPNITNENNAIKIENKFIGTLTKLALDI